jgi:hypothetical protein
MLSFICLLCNLNLVKCCYDIQLNVSLSLSDVSQSLIYNERDNDSSEWFSSSHSSSHRIKVHLLTSVWIKQMLQQMSYWLVWTAYSKVLLMSYATLVASLIMLYKESQSTFNSFHLSLLVQFDDLCLLFLRDNFSVIIWSNTFKTHDNDQSIVLRSVFFVRLRLFNISHADWEHLNLLLFLFFFHIRFVKNIADIITWLNSLSAEASLFCMIVSVNSTVRDSVCIQYDLVLLHSW